MMGLLTSRLSLKLIACLGGSMIVVFTGLGYRHLQIHRGDLEEMTHQSADSLGGIIKASLRYSMLTNHREDIERTIQSIGVVGGIRRVRVFNKEGRISFSSEPSEVGNGVDKKAEACYACHAAEQPLAHLDRPERVRTYSVPQGERILGLIIPINNEKSCWEADCHAHDSGQRVLGVLDVTMSLASVDATIATGQRGLLGNLAIAVSSIVVLFAVLIWQLVHRPVRRLFKGTRQVASGNLDHRITVSSSDEIGDLADSFNSMTRALKRAQDELRDWGTNLERRVEEKTAELKKIHEHVLQVERLASMGKLAAIVAHEINNPLTGILTAARFLLKKMNAPELAVCASSPVLRENLEMIATESSRCGDIVKGLLQFARQGKGDYHPCQVGALVEEALRLVRHKLDLCGAAVEARVGEDLPPVLGDPQEIRQALVAVLINACDAMPQGEGRLETTVRAVEDGKWVELSIRDNGIGMDEETQKHIFEPFFSTKPEGAGVGLGLAVVSGIVTRHAGRIEVNSSPGKGTTFSVFLPAVRPDSVPERAGTPPGAVG